MKPSCIIELLSHMQSIKFYFHLISMFHSNRLCSHRIINHNFLYYAVRIGSLTETPDAVTIILVRKIQRSRLWKLKQTCNKIQRNRLWKLKQTYSKIQRSRLWKLKQTYSKIQWRRLWKLKQTCNKIQRNRLWKLKQTYSKIQRRRLLKHKQIYRWDHF